MVAKKPLEKTDSLALIPALVLPEHVGKIIDAWTDNWYDGPLSRKNLPGWANLTSQRLHGRKPMLHFLRITPSYPIAVKFQFPAPRNAVGDDMASLAGIFARLTAGGVAEQIQPLKIDTDQIRRWLAKQPI